MPVSERYRGYSISDPNVVFDLFRVLPDGKVNITPFLYHNLRHATGSLR